jgi:predicted nucleotidyltransferase
VTFSSQNVTLPRKEIEEFCQRWQITELALFGSVLREDFGPDSDLDFLVTFAPEAGWSLLDHVEMQDELQVILGRPVDLLTRAGIERSQNYLRRRAILNSAEVIHVSS